jgi:hypothetical protein
MGNGLDESRSLKLWPSCLGLWLLACGAAAAPEPQSTAAPAPAPRLTELDALERDFEVSSSQLMAQLRRRELEASPQSSPVPGQAAVPVPAAPRREPKDADDGRKKNQESAGAPLPAEQRAAEGSTPAPDYAAIGSPCDLMCRALSSMQRSAGGICSLAGEEHERCRRARSRLKLAEEQVGRAGCACLETR